jgi:hypothetical protein
MKSPKTLGGHGIFSLAAIAFCFAMIFTTGCATTDSGATKATDAAATTLPPPVDATPLPLKSDRAKLTKLGTNDFDVRCDGVREFAVVQRGDRWCWAACAQMILNYNGVHITQEKIVRKMEKSPEADPKDAGLFEIWLAMNPELIQEMNRRQAAWQENNTTEINAHVNASNMGNVINSMTDPSTDALVQEISSGNPVVVGLHGGQWGGGHVVLAYGVEYSRSRTKGDAEYKDMTMIFYRFQHRFQVRKILIIDPQPLEGQSQFVELNADDLKLYKDFTVGKADAKKQLEDYMKVYMPTPDEMHHN